MRVEKSCGVILFRREPELSFLLLKHPHRLDLPKGHVEGEETEIETALRELWEETGVASDAVDLDPTFRFPHTYYPRIARQGGQTVEKTVVLFLGWLTKETDIRVSEHGDFGWYPWRPPHRIDPRTVDQVLAAVESHFALNSANSAN